MRGVFIFRKIDQTFNALIPQNLSDSASSSISQLNNRMITYFPSRDDNNLWNFSSNIFSSSIGNIGVNLYIKNNSFSKDNTLGFSLGINIIIRDENGDEIIQESFEKEFNANQKQGPSVNYLSSLLSIATKN